MDVLDDVDGLKSPFNVKIHYRIAEAVDPVCAQCMTILRYTAVGTYMLTRGEQPTCILLDSINNLKHVIRYVTCKICVSTRFGEIIDLTAQGT